MIFFHIIIYVGNTRKLPRNYFKVPTYIGPKFGRNSIPGKLPNIIEVGEELYGNQVLMKTNKPSDFLGGVMPLRKSSRAPIQEERGQELLRQRQ